MMNNLEIAAQDLIGNLFLKEKETIAEAIAMFQKAPYAALPVTDDKGCYLGIASLRDLLEKDGKDLIAGLIVPYPPVKMFENMDKIRWPEGCDIIPVANEHNVFLGFITKETVINRLYEAYRKTENELASVLASFGDYDLNKNTVNELNSIIEASYDGLYICDKDGRVVRVNTAWEKISGFSRHSIIGRNVKELVAEGYYDNSAALLTLEKKKTTTTMLKITSGPKKGQVIMATGTPILDGNGELVQVVVNVRDITDLENLKAQLNETRELTRRYADELEEIRLQHQKVDDIVVKSPAMQRIIELVVRVSQVDSTVLITGESGVGKEVIARKIHLLSRRKNNSLIKINCGAIPGNLLESELFGYEEGAFSGARREGKPGMFELASGGTLFLDEIGDLPLNLQVKLLRALQEKEIYRVGGTKPIQVDARIIAATNKDLRSMMKKGAFREDLFYRLNVVNIEIPPLRERREDLVSLIPAILHKLNDKYNQKKRLSPQVVERLLRYHWPGNIREVENTLERLVVLTNEDVISPEHLPDFLKEEKSHKLITFDSLVPLKTAVEEVEHQILAMALEKYGSTRAMARALGVNQSTIVRKMRQYRMDKSDALEHLDGA